jgi:hypothetical protein
MRRAFLTGPATENREISCGEAKLNGQDVSSPSAGYSTIYPVLESIQEVQIVGIGGTAEYGGYSGASVNVITKSGSNAWHGSLTGTYTDHRFMEKRYGSNYSYFVDYDVQSSLTLGGPIIKDRLFFFIAPGFAAKDYAYWSGDTGGTSGSTFKRPNYYGKLDFLLNNKNTLSFLWNSNPGTQTYYSANPVGLYKMPSSNNSFFLSLQTIFSEKTFGNLRLNFFKDNIDMTPVYPEAGNAYLTDYISYANYGPFYMDRSVYDQRFQADGNVAHYLDGVLGASHELKLGFEFERSFTGEERIWLPMITISDPGAGVDIIPVTGSVQGPYHTRQYINRICGFVQDNLRFGQRFNLNVGVRYENPILKARDFSGNIASYKILSPRLGFSYDLTGKWKTVVQGSLGCYYTHPITQTFANCTPGRGDSYSYSTEISRADYLANFDGGSADGIDWVTAQLVKPENVISVNKYSIPAVADPDLKQYGTFQISAGFRQQLFTNLSLEIDYMFKKGFNRYQMISGTTHTYEHFEWVDPYLGNTLDFWKWTDGLADETKTLANTSSIKNRHHMLFVVLRKRPTHNWSMMLSYTYQNSYSNESGYGGSDIFGSPEWNVETDPYYTETQSLRWGRSWTRPHQFKLQASWFAPWGFIVGLSGFYMSENVGQAQLYYYQLPTSIRNDAVLRPYGYITYVLLEQKGSRTGRMIPNLDGRIAKKIRLFKTNFELQCDVFNILNKDYSYGMNWFYLLTNPTAPKRSGGLLQPRNIRFGLTWSF